MQRFQIPLQESGGKNRLSMQRFRAPIAAHLQSHCGGTNPRARLDVFCAACNQNPLHYASCIPQQLRRVATRERGAQSALVRAQQRRRLKVFFRLQTLHHRAGLLSLRRQGSGSGVVKRAQALAGAEEEPEGCDEGCC